MWEPGDTQWLKKHGRRHPGPPDIARAGRESLRESHGTPFPALLLRVLLQPWKLGKVVWADLVYSPHPTPY